MAIKNRNRFANLELVYRPSAPGSSVTRTSSLYQMENETSGGVSTGRNTPMKLRPFTNYVYQHTQLEDGPWASSLPTIRDSYGNVAQYGSTTTGSGVMGLSGVYGAGSPNFGSAKAIEIQSELSQTTLRNILSNIKNCNFDAGVFLGEAKTTFLHIAHTARRIAHAYTALRRGNLVGVEQALGCGKLRRSSRFHTQYVRDPASAAANYWLEYQYGWKPLLSDAHAVGEEFAKRNLGESPKKLKVTASAYRTWTVNEVISSPPIYASRVHTLTVTDRRVALLQVTSPLFAQASALGLTNPLNIAWELLPFSFVVDWFLPVGDYVSALDASAGMAITHGSHAVKLKGTCATDYSDSNPSNPQHGSAKRLATFYTRSVEIPSASGILFNLKNPFSVPHLATSLALLKQAFGRS